MMNYHEMTMSEPRDSPARRQQFLVICAVMAAISIHTILQSGCLSPLVMEETTLEGGLFIYKETKRDYAASGSLEEFIATRDLGIKKNREYEFVDQIYTIYLDDPSTGTLGGRQQRFASGYLLRNDNEQYETIKQLLLSKNQERIPPTLDELQDLRALLLWPKLEYKTAVLPTSKAVTAQSTDSGGFVSAILFSMRIIPALRKYAATKLMSTTSSSSSESENDQQCSITAITVISTCSTRQQVCTHYAPITNGQDFLLGYPDYDTYVRELKEAKTS